MGNKPDISGKSMVYRQSVVLAAVSLIFLGCLIILKPFIPALLLAAILSLSTWPAFVWLENKLKGHTTLAAALMTLFLILCFLVPLGFLGTSLAESFHGFITAISAGLQSDNIIQTPQWVKDVPWAGPHLDDFWQTYLSNKQQVTDTVKDHSGLATDWLIAIGAGIGHGIIDISLGVVMAFFFFQRGQFFVRRLRNLIENFGGTKSIQLMHLCANTVIGVVYGILGTAFVLAGLATIGFWIAGVPGAPFLGLLTFLCGIIPGGPPIVLAPVTVWLFMQGHQAMGIFMALWSFAIVSALDVLIRPILISRGAKMPLLLVLLGVFGGVASFGFIGLFIGPALLAIASAMAIEWSSRGGLRH